MSSMAEAEAEAEAEVGEVAAEATLGQAAAALAKAQLEASRTRLRPLFTRLSNSLCLALQFMSRLFYSIFTRTLL
jgi:hypothetical protein